MKITLPHYTTQQEAIKKIDQIKRKDCRTHVEKNFTLKQMVDKYEKIYKKLC